MTYAAQKVTPKGVFVSAPYSGGFKRDDDDDAPTPPVVAADPDQPTLNQGRDSDGNLSPEEATYKKRYGDLRAEFNRKTSEAQQKVTDLTSRLDQLAAQVTPEAMPKTPEQLAEWMREYPEMASVIRSLAKAEVDAEVSSVKSRLADIDNREKELVRQKAAMKLSERHPDIEALRQSTAFHAWARTKSKIVQEALYGDEDDPEAAADAIYLYKSEKGLLNRQVKQSVIGNLDASLDIDTPQSGAEPLGDNKRSWSESEVQSMSDRDYAAYEDEIALAMAEGRFKYDLSLDAA